MLIRSYRRSLPYLFITLVFLMYTAFHYLEGPLIVPPREFGFIDNVECMVAVLVVPFFCFVLPSKYEIELSLVCGTRMSTLFFSKTLPVLTYTFIPAFLFVILYRYIPYRGSSPVVIPIHVPDNFRLLTLVSLFVTVFFFFSLIVFARVLLRNCYAPIFVGLFAYNISHQLCKNIQSGTVDIKKCLYDPFISVYFMGNEMANEIATNNIKLQSLHNVWTYNRLLFFGLGVLLLVFTYLLLRREKLHKGFGD